MLDVIVSSKGLMDLLRELGVNRGSVQNIEFLEFMDGHKSRRQVTFAVRLTGPQVDKLRRHITEDELRDRYDR